MSEFSKFLLKKMQEFELEKGHRVSIAVFADEKLHQSQQLVTNWLNETNVPSYDKAFQISEILGPEVFDLLGYSRPDITLRYVVKNWEKLSPEAQAKIQRILDEYLNKQNSSPFNEQSLNTPKA